MKPSRPDDIPTWMAAVIFAAAACMCTLVIFGSWPTATHTPWAQDKDNGYSAEQEALWMQRFDAEQKRLELLRQIPGPKPGP